MVRRGLQEVLQGGVLPQCGPGDGTARLARAIAMIDPSVTWSVEVDNHRAVRVPSLLRFPSPWGLWTNYSSIFLGPLFDFHRADQAIILVSIYSTLKFRPSSWTTHSASPVRSFPPSMSIRLTTKP